MIVALLLSALTIDEAVQRALRHDPEVRVARASLVVASAETAVARSLPAPEFRMSMGNFDADPDTFRDRTTIGMRYSPPRPREIAIRQSIAKVREQTAQAEIGVAEARAAAGVRLLFRRAVMAHNRALLAERLVELAKKKRRTLLRQVSAGIKDSEEKDLADLDVEEAENTLRRTTSLARNEMSKLARLLGPEESLEDGLAMDPELLQVPASFKGEAELIEQALLRRAELKVVEGACREYELEGKLAGNRRYPWISFVEASYRVTYLPSRGPWGWKFGVDLPFFRSSAAAETRLAAAREAKCRAQHGEMAASIRTQVADAIASLETLRSELAGVDRLRSGPAARAFERAQLALKAGRADQVDVFDAEARLLTMQDRWLERRLQYVDLESQFEEAIGGPLSPSVTN